MRCDHIVGFMDYQNKNDFWYKDRLIFESDMTQSPISEDFADHFDAWPCKVIKFKHCPLCGELLNWKVIATHALLAGQIRWQIGVDGKKEEEHIDIGQVEAKHFFENIINGASDERI